MNEKIKKSENRKRLIDELQRKNKQEFEQNLPMNRASFEKLFDFLDSALNAQDCDDTTALTKMFLKRNNFENKENILTWLAQNGGHCDCEILANVEDQFE